MTGTKEKELTQEQLREKYLPNKIVWLKKVPGKDLTAIKKDPNFSAHQFMYDNAIVERWLTMDDRMNYYDPFDGNKEEKKFFETELNRNLGLDYRNPECAWNTSETGIRLRFTVDQKFKANGYRFDLSKPYENLMYKVALKQRDVAKDLKTAKSKTHYIFYISDGEEESKANSEKFSTTSKVYKYFGKIEESKEKMKEFLTLYYINTKDIKEVPESISEEALRNEIHSLIDVSINKVLATIEDPNVEAKIFMIKGLKAGAIIKKGINSYAISGMENDKYGLEEFIEHLKLLEKKKDTDDTYGIILNRIQLSES